MTQRNISGCVPYCTRTGHSRCHTHANPLPFFFCFSFYLSGSRCELLIPTSPTPQCFISHVHVVFSPRVPCLSFVSRLILQTSTGGVPSPRNPSEPWPGLRSPSASFQQCPAEKTSGVLLLPWLHPWQTSLMDHNAVIQRTLLGSAGTACLDNTKQMIKSDSGLWSSG